MSEHDLTELETRALAALDKPAFPVNLRQIRTTVSQLLGEVGRYGFFDEYTDHSFKHVAAMLETARWIIPEETKHLLTPGDWLLLVLSIYFHDVGLLISRGEYAKRGSNPEFAKFKAEPPVPKDKHDQFMSRLDQLESDAADRLLYQEFVRHTHGERVRGWIEGVALDDNDAASEQRRLIAELFQPLDPTIRRDLGLVCESHTKDDISDTGRFKVSQPYGSSREETVNLQYIAAVLRTVDLLQITKDRAPAVLFQVINPADPVGQVEWQRQGSVRSVRPKPGLDREGNASADVLPDTIEVHARFEQSEGFFGLTSYLVYAERELQSCHTAISKSARLLPQAPKYPWRYIDSSGVEAAGFLTESYGFSLDQQRILDLLTGHTLYNDTTVVLRELTQNALDAVRLQSEIDRERGQTPEPSRIDIVWDSSARILTVSDNGTGMSQETIVNHLLKVGSSRYQDPQFKEKHPNFSSISRFGIGVLSAFMVSDDVQITTCSPEDENARRIALRSVHGKYLIKLLDKVADRDEIGVFPHGTKVRLALRPTASIGDVTRIARMWLMFPGCRVTVKVDEQEAVPIGYGSPREAIERYLSTSARERSRYWKEVEVRELSEDGVTLAYAVARSGLFKDWSFVELPRERRPENEHDVAPIATCIEGVGVDFNSPGFQAPGILAVANAVGPGAPKTNVARSALEDTAEQRQMLSTIYALYARHVSSEIVRLREEESYSLSRAVGEAPYIAASLLASTAPVSRPGLMREAMAAAPIILIEGEGERKSIPYVELLEMGEFWTVESPLSRSIETFVREAPTDLTAELLLRTLGNSASAYPGRHTMCNFSSASYIDNMVSSDFEVSEISASETLRRIAMRWRRKGDSSRWMQADQVFLKVAQADRRFASQLGELRESTRAHRASYEVLSVPVHDVQFSGADSSSGFVSARHVYLRGGSRLANLLLSRRPADDDLEGLKRLACTLAVTDLIMASGWSWETLTEEMVTRLFNVNQSALKPYMGDLPELVDSIRSTPARMFNPFAWDRRDG